jgi:membrane associated rhomboid family serine protease
MIPLKDIDRWPSRFPLITSLIIAGNTYIFFLELINGDPFLNRWSLIPAEFTSGQNLITILTAMFLHAGWLHIIGNMIFFWAFGPAIEGMMGRVKYLVFYLAGGLVAFVVQIAMNSNSTIPTLGASGAIAAVMGAFLVTFPRDRIRTLIFLGFFVFVRFIPAVFLVGFWFIMQLLNEVGSLTQGQIGGVAYMAHIGGFIFGFVFGRLFENRKWLS